MKNQKRVFTEPYTLESKSVALPRLCQKLRWTGYAYIDINIDHVLALGERLQPTSSQPRRTRELIPDDVKIFVWNRDGGKCVRCGSQMKLEFDHNTPVSKGGSNTARNIQLRCETCNRAKGDSIAYERRPPAPLAEAEAIQRMIEGEIHTDLRAHVPGR